MKAFLLRYTVRVLFPTAVVYGALRLNASNFDATEITTIWECFALFNAFEIGMSLLPAKIAGKLRFPIEASNPDSMRLAGRVATAALVALFCAAFLAVAIDIRREIGGLREAFASGDVQTTWPDGIELRTVRTTKTSESDWFERHVAAVREARARPR